MTSPSPRRNAILAALAADVFSRLLPELEPVELSAGRVLYEAGDTIDYIYFPTDCIVSLVSTAADGSHAELAMAGNDGLVGLSLLLGHETMSVRAVVQSAGGAFRLNSELLLWELDQDRDLERQVLRYARQLMDQMAQTVVCHRHHSVDQQFCRWLLMSLDRLAGSQVDLTQVQIADVLGVRREAVLEAARTLQAAGSIAYHRGHIRVIDRSGLLTRVCKCYTALTPDAQRPHPALPRVLDRQRPRRPVAGLRKQAESRLRLLPPVPVLGVDEAGRLLHELQVHQIELEMQNDEVANAYAEADALRARYADIYDFAPLAYVSLDTHGVIRQMNLAGSILLGLKRSEDKPRRFAALLNKASLPPFNGFLLRVMEGHSRERCELELLPTAQRESATVLVEAVRDEDCLECRMVLSDITAQKQSTRALLESEARFRQLIDNLPLSVVIAQDGLIRLTNPRTLELLGYTRGELIGAPFMPMIADATDAGTVMAAHQRQMAGATDTFVFELRLIGKGGYEVDGRLHANAIEWHGRLASLGVIEDITERRRADAALASSELRQRTLIKALPDFVLLLDNQGHITSFHSPPEHLGLLTVTDEVIGQPYQQAIPPLLAAPLGQQMAQLVSDDQLRYFSATVEFGGLARDLDVRLCRVLDSHQKPTGFFLVAHDVTAVRELRAQEQLLVAALGALGDAVVITGPAGAIEWLNPAFEALTGYPFEEAIRQNLRDLVKSDQQNPACFAEMWNTILAGQVWRGELINARKDGSLYDTALTVAPVQSPGGAILHFVGIQHDISQRKRLEAELKSLASTDYLTGLPNRRHFMARLEEELGRVQRREGYQASLLMFDLDHFKRVNDSLGHAGGDAVLRAFAGLLGEELRKVDLAGRVGGEEFAVVLADSDAEAAAVLAERLRGRVEQALRARVGQAVGVTVSIGIAQIDAGDLGIDAALERADAALYRAKEGGRNRIEPAAQHAADLR